MQGGIGIRKYWGLVLQVVLLFVRGMWLLAVGMPCIAVPVDCLGLRGRGFASRGGLCTPCCFLRWYPVAVMLVAGWRCPLAKALSCINESGKSL